MCNTPPVLHNFRNLCELDLFLHHKNIQVVNNDSSSHFPIIPSYNNSMVAVNPRCMLGGILIIIVNFITITLITKHAACIYIILTSLLLKDYHFLSKKRRVNHIVVVQLEYSLLVHLFIK